MLQRLYDLSSLSGIEHGGRLVLDLPGAFLGPTAAADVDAASQAARDVLEDVVAVAGVRQGALGHDLRLVPVDLQAAALRHLPAEAWEAAGKRTKVLDFMIFVDFRGFSWI